jgi:hypothetical protein
MPSVQTLATGSAAVLASFIIIGVPSTATAGGPGNNGTVKVAPYGDVDSIPNNTPHVGCTFQLEWYGFDANVASTVTFEQQSPTTDGTMSVAGESPVTLDGDPGNGAGNDGFDATAPYTLSFTGAPHPQQGYHVALTISTPESNGATVKHKVFWVEGCGTATQPPTPPVKDDETPTPPVKDDETPTPPVKDDETPTPPVKDDETPASTQTTTPASPEGTQSTAPSTPAENSVESDDDNVDGDLEVLGVEASANTNGQGASSQAQAGHSAGVTVAPRQQAVPTSINAGTTASATGTAAVLPASLAALGALLGLLALAAHRRRA